MMTNIPLKLCAAIYLLLIAADFLRTKSIKRLALELIPLIALIALDVALASANAGYLTFGAPATPSLGVLLGIFAAVVCGVAARYIFYLKGAFSWLDFLKPLCISPLLLLPLMGSLQSIKALEPIQLISFALLAFQNGFFWQSVLDKSRPKR